MKAIKRRWPLRATALATTVLAVSTTGVASGRDNGQDRSRDVQKAIDGGRPATSSC